MPSTTTTFSSNLKRGSNVLSDTKPDILNTTTTPNMHTHKKRKLDDGNHPDLSFSTSDTRTLNRSVPSRPHSGWSNHIGSSGPQRKKDPNGSPVNRTETLVSTRRVGPSVVVRRYEVVVARPKAKEGTIHTPQPRRNTDSTSTTRPTLSPSGAKAKTRPASDSQPPAKATPKKDVIGANTTLTPHSRKQKNPSSARSTRTKDKPRRVPARAIVVAERLSAEKVQKLMARIGMEGYRMPPTMARLPKFRKNKEGSN